MQRQQQPYFVYILKCVWVRNGSSSIILYTGKTNNIKRRFQEHKKGRAKYTRRFEGNVEIAYLRAKFDTPEVKASSWAYYRELEIKTFSRTKKEKLIDDHKKRTKELCAQYLT